MSNSPEEQGSIINGDEDVIDTERRSSGQIQATRYSKRNSPDANMAIYKDELTRFLEELSEGIPSFYKTAGRLVWQNLSIRYGLRVSERGQFNFQKHRFLDCLKDERKEAPRFIREDPEKMAQFNTVRDMFKEVHRQMGTGGEAKDIKPSVDPWGDQYHVQLHRFLIELSTRIPSAYIEEGRKIWSNLARRYKLTEDSEIKQFNYEKHRFLDCLENEKKSAPMWIRDDPEQLTRFNTVKTMIKEARRQLNGSENGDEARDFKPFVNVDDIYQEQLYKFLQELSAGIPPAYIEDGRQIWSNLARRYNFTKASEIKQFNYEKHRFLNIFELNVGGAPSWVKEDPIKLDKFGAVKRQFKELQRIRKSFASSDRLDRRGRSFKRKRRERSSHSGISQSSFVSVEHEQKDAVSSEDEGGLPPPKRFVKSVISPQFSPPSLFQASVGFEPLPFDMEVKRNEEEEDEGEDWFGDEEESGDHQTTSPSRGETSCQVRDAPCIVQSDGVNKEAEEGETLGEDEEETMDLTEENKPIAPMEMSEEVVMKPKMPSQDIAIEANPSSLSGITPEECIRALKQEIHILREELKMYKARDRAEKGVDTGDLNAESQIGEDNKRIEPEINEPKKEQEQMACAWAFVFEYRTKYDKLAAAVRREDSREQMERDFPEMSTSGSADEDSTVSVDREVLDVVKRERRASSDIRLLEGQSEQSSPDLRACSRRNSPDTNMAVFKEEFTRFLEELSEGIPRSYVIEKRAAWKDLSVRYGLRVSERGQFNFQKHRFLDCLEEEKKQAPKWIIDDPEQLTRFNKVKAMMKKARRQMNGTEKGDEVGSKDIKPAVDTDNAYQEQLYRFLIELSTGIPPAYIEEGRKIWSSLFRRYNLTETSEIRSFNYRKHRFIDSLEMEVRDAPNWVKEDPVKLAKFTAIKRQFHEIQKIRERDGITVSETNPRTSGLKRRATMAVSPSTEASPAEPDQEEPVSSEDEGGLPPPKRFVKRQTVHSCPPSGLPASVPYSKPPSIPSLLQDNVALSNVKTQKIEEEALPIAAGTRSSSEGIKIESTTPSQVLDEPIPGDETEYDEDEEEDEDEEDEEGWEVEEKEDEQEEGEEAGVSGEDEPIESVTPDTAAPAHHSGEEAVFSRTEKFVIKDTVPGDGHQGLSQEQVANMDADIPFQDIAGTSSHVAIESGQSSSSGVTPEERIRVLEQEIHALREELKGYKERDRAEKGVDTADLNADSQKEVDDSKRGAEISEPKKEQEQMACAWTFVFEYRTKYDKLAAAVRREDSREQMKRDFPEIFV